MLINCKQLLLSVYWCMSKDKDPGLHNITSAPAPNSTEEGINRMRKRVDADDAAAIYNFGAYYMGDGEIRVSQTEGYIKFDAFLESTPPYIGLIESSKCTEYENNV